MLLNRFVASFSAFDDMKASEELDPIQWTFSFGEIDEYGWKSWKLAKVASDRSLLDPIYAELPAQYPPLFESLVLSYRWPEVELGLCCLMANPLGPNLSGLLLRDDNLTESLIPGGYIQFAKGPDYDYDPVCFDISARTKNGDYRIVKLDHEEILCNHRLKIIEGIGPEF